MNTIILKPKQVLDLINELFEIELRIKSQIRFNADLKRMYYYFSYKYCISSSQEDIAVLLKMDRSNIPRQINSLIDIIDYNERLKNIFSLIDKTLNQKFDLSYINNAYGNIENLSLLSLKRSNLKLSTENYQLKSKLARRESFIKKIKEKH